MSGPPRVSSMNVAELEARPVLGPTGNKARPMDTRKPGSKPLKKPENPRQEAESKDKRVFSSPPPSPHSRCVTVPSLLKQQDRYQMLLNFPMNGSCSSDASSDSSNSRASSGRGVKRGGGSAVRRRQCCSKMVDKAARKVGVDDIARGLTESLDAKKRCAWVTPNTDPCYAAFHDEEWGVPVHDDKKLFELLSLSGALAELTWPSILAKRHLFSEIFLDFDPSSLSKVNEKKITPGSPASSLLSEPKVRAIIENARQMCKIINEFGSFNKYLWIFVNHKPIVNQSRYPRQVPVKTSKAEVISKDLVRRGFRSVGLTVIYTFMQVAGLTNDHLISCFRFQECMTLAGE